jgi:hypothetical protein
MLADSREIPNKVPFSLLDEFVVCRGCGRLD